MKGNDATQSRSIRKALAEAGLLEHVLTHDAGSALFQYAGQLIRDSDRLAKERPNGDYVSLREIAEWEFAANRHGGPTWMMALEYHLSGKVDSGGLPFRDWREYRAEALGNCFFSKFADVNEGLPLYVKEGDKFRVASAADDCYRSVGHLIENVWPDNVEVYEPPPWSGSLYFKQSDQQIHRFFFGDWYDVKPEALREKAKNLRLEAFRRALRDEGRPPRTVGANLRPIADTWPLVRDILKVSGFQAIAFVEDAFERLGLVLYLDDDTTGLYTPRAGDVHGLLGDLGTSNFASYVANGDESSAERERESWGKLRVTPSDFEAILSEARNVAGTMPGATAADIGQISQLIGERDSLRAERDSLKAALDRAIEQKTRDVLQDHDDRLRPRERETLRKLWYFLARNYGFELGAAKNDAPTKFLQQLRNKCNLEMDHKTIRERMREAMEQFSPTSGKTRGAS